MAWTMLLVAMWIAVMRTPATPLARAPWRLTVEMPNAWAAGVRCGDVLIIVLLATAAALIFWWIDREAIQLLAMAWPDIGVWLVTFEVGTYLDALTAVLVATSALRLRGIAAFCLNRGHRPRSAARLRPRRRRRSTRRAAVNDDEDHRRAA